MSLAVGGLIFLAAITIYGLRRTSQTRKSKRSALNNHNRDRLYSLVYLPSVGQNGIYKVNGNVLGMNQISEIQYGVYN